jgi:hypothetical protein
MTLAYVLVGQQVQMEDPRSRRCLRLRIRVVTAARVVGDRLATKVTGPAVDAHAAVLVASKPAVLVHAGRVHRVGYQLADPLIVDDQTDGDFPRRHHATLWYAEGGGRRRWDLPERLVSRSALSTSPSR